MQSRNRMLDDLARVAGGALGVATGMREEVEARLRDRFEPVCVCVCVRVRGAGAGRG